jgi:ATP-dependent helicase/nuclease subunit A
MLEASAKDTKVDLDLMAENLLKEEGLPLDEKELLIKSVKAVMNSELCQRRKKAERTLVEVPFSLRVDGKDLTRVVSGIIDLAFKEADGWVIADYKSDKVDGTTWRSSLHTTSPRWKCTGGFGRRCPGRKSKKQGFTSLIAVSGPSSDLEAV